MAASQSFEIEKFTCDVALMCGDSIIGSYACIPVVTSFEYNC